MDFNTCNDAKRRTHPTHPSLRSRDCKKLKGRSRPTEGGEAGSLPNNPYLQEHSVD